MAAGLVALTGVGLAAPGCKGGSSGRAGDDPAGASGRPDGLGAEDAAADEGAAAPAPRSTDCRSWADLDVAELPPLPESPYRRNFETVWRTVLERHYDPTLGCLDWPELRRIYGARLAEVPDETAAFEVFNALLATLGQSHLRATPPYRHTDGAAERLQGGPALVPLSLRLIDDGAYVSDNELDGHRAPVPTGARLLEVDGADVAAAIARGRHAGHRPVERSLHATRAVEALLRCPAGGERALSYLDPAQDDARVTTTVACVLPEGERVSLGNLRELSTRVRWKILPALPDPARGAASETTGARVGYLAFNYWMVPMVARVREGMEALRAEGMEALVLDLRGNPGGVGAMAIPVARLLLDEPGDLGALRMREMTTEFKVTPGPDPFTGPVVLLVDEGTASTSEIFAVGLRDLGRVEVVGASPSAGLALPSLIETLPDGGLLQYVVGDYRSPRGTEAEGEGVVPDLLVPVTRDDLVAGRDPVLEAGQRRAAEAVAARR